MRPFNGTRLTIWAVVFCLWFLTFVCAADKSGATSNLDEGGPVLDLLLAQPFRLDKPYTHTWRKEQPLVSAGYLLVLAVDPEFVRPKQAAEPVLYVGEQTAERVNAGNVSGRLVVIVPSSLNARGEVALDLSKALIWFGTPELPERIDAAQVNAAAHIALRKGVKPFSEPKVRAALRRGGKILRLPNREALERQAALLLQQYSPNETDLIQGLMMSNK